MKRHITWFALVLVAIAASLAATGAAPAGVVTGTGTEAFEGCLDANGDASCGGSEPTGTLEFSFELSAKYDPITFAQQHGRCHHPITGGTGDFAGATGGLHFKDDPVNGCSYYSGHLTLGG